MFDGGSDSVRCLVRSYVISVIWSEIWKESEQLKMEILRSWNQNSCNPDKERGSGSEEMKQQIDQSADSRFMVVFTEQLI